MTDGLQARQVEGEAAFVATLANERDWDLSADSLQSYWKTEGQLTDPKLGEFGVGRVYNPGLPLGAQEQELWVVYRGSGDCWVFGPLITQLPPTRESQHKATSSAPILIATRGAEGTLIWVELRSRVNEYLDGGANVKATEWTYGYAFRVSARAQLACVAFRVPVEMRTTVDDVLQREAALTVTFPEPSALAVAQSTRTIEAEQQQWLGRHPLGYFAIETLHMVLVEGGTFEMGDTFGDGQGREKPVHTVTVSSFWIAKTEVTFEQYDRYCEETGRRKPLEFVSERGNRPVNGVSCFDAAEHG